MRDPGAPDRPRRERSTSRIIFGDWQTPLELASAALKLLPAGFSPRTVIEPTCGVGTFLEAAAKNFPEAALFGRDRATPYIEVARARVPKANLAVADFFTVDWSAVLSSAEEPRLILGNPPWVTASALGGLGAENGAGRTKEGHLKGFAALTGESNFDVSERMLRTLLRSMSGRGDRLLMICKASVARKLLLAADRDGLAVTAELRPVETQKTFGAAVDAVILHAWMADMPGERWTSFGAASGEAVRQLWVERGRVVREGAEATDLWEGTSTFTWRSGIKHDVAKVMELRADGAVWRNGWGEPVDIEHDWLYPMMKSSDVANARAISRAMIVPQKRLSESTASLQGVAPKLWRYLTGHARDFAGRKSRVYAGKSQFSVFGVGDYTFEPYKIAISGLYKRIAFRLVGPHNSRPVVFDDTVYFLSFGSAEEAGRVLRVLDSAESHRFFESRAFWDDKRPINKKLLASFCVERGL